MFRSALAKDFSGILEAVAWLQLLRCGILGACLTLLSGATRRALGKRPECRKSLRRGRSEAVEARLLPPECRKSLWQGRCGTFEG